jgi:hypothetical protein
VTTPEPTIADVLARIDNLDRVLGLELRAFGSELRADIAILRLDTTTSLSTLFDELAAFRAEYNSTAHIHEDEG